MIPRVVRGDLFIRFPLQITYGVGFEINPWTKDCKLAFPMGSLAWPLKSYLFKVYRSQSPLFEFNVSLNLLILRLDLIL